MSVLSRVFLLLTLCGIVYYKTVTCQSTEETDKSDESEESSTEALNDTVPQDLYVIKTVVYEVGILTDAANVTDNSTETHELVDLSFFDPSTNGSVIDLSNIPVPIQTNVSEVTVTKLVPSSDLASILLPPNARAGSVLPAKQVVVIQNISTTDPVKGAEIISNLPKLLGLTKEKESGSGSESATKASKKEDKDELFFELE